jgi:hypothetical protein
LIYRMRVARLGSAAGQILIVANSTANNNILPTQTEGLMAKDVKSVLAESSIDNIMG